MNEKVKSVQFGEEIATNFSKQVKEITFTAGSQKNYGDIKIDVSLKIEKKPMLGKKHLL